MAKIVSDFRLLPTHNDADWIAIYTEVFNQLIAMGLSVPPTPPALTSRAVLLDLLQLHASVLLRAEIVNDPLNLGYAGMNPAQICKAISDMENAPKGPDHNPGRLFHIFHGLPFSPNEIKPNDVNEAMRNG